MDRNSGTLQWDHIHNRKIEWKIMLIPFHNFVKSKKKYSGSIFRK